MEKSNKVELSRRNNIVYTNIIRVKIKHTSLTNECLIIKKNMQQNLNIYIINTIN